MVVAENYTLFQKPFSGDRSQKCLNGEIVLLLAFLSKIGKRMFSRISHNRFIICLVLSLNGVIYSALTLAANPEGVQIPVIVNIYASSTTKDKAKEAIEEANKILKQAGVKLVVVEVNNPPGGDNGDNDNNGEFTGKEGDKARTFGGKELKKLKNQKGIKISFANKPSSLTNTPGISIHRNPTILVKDRGDKAKTAETIAHEIGHVMTLGSGHKIDKTTKANKGGHAPNKPGNNGKDNLMAPREYRTGTHLTPDQIAEIRKQWYVHGKCAAQWKKAFPAIPFEMGFGGQTDERMDQNSTKSQYQDQSQDSAQLIYDLGEIILTTLKDSSNIDAQLTVLGVLPENEEINATYALGFDTDANSATGITYAEQEGIDKIVRIILKGKKSLNTFSIIGEIEETISNIIIPLPQVPIIETENEFLDSDEPSIAVATSLLFSIPKDLLVLSAPEIPIIVSAGNDELIIDTTKFIFDLERWLDDPTLKTSGNGIPKPGQPYPFAITGLEPNSSFNLFLDDTLVFSGTLDTTGSIEGEFIFPSNFSNREIHFLTGQDNTGEFAYNITCPDNYPWLVELDSFSLAPIQNNVLLEWRTGAELNNAGFRLWRGAIDENSELTDLIVFGEKLTKIKIGGDTSKVKACGLDLECIKDKLRNVDILEQGKEIKPKGSEREGAHYSYLDTSANHEGWTYYYLLEDLDTNGNRTFHWDFLKKVN